ncbi:MAG: hypothetical protein ACR2RB_08200 [Gammaproteobacteria bacterium]
MANVAWASGHILCRDGSQRNALLEKIELLPDEPYKSDFSIWKGIFHAPEYPCRAGYIVTFGLSHKYFGEVSEVGRFLDFWEELISDIRANELFIALEQEFMGSYELFGKFYFQWSWVTYPKTTEGRWVFRGTMPVDQNWKSHFETEIEDVTAVR